MKSLVLMKKVPSFFMAAALFAVLTLTAGHAQAALLARGAVSPAHGYPAWYQDLNGLALSLCLDQTPIGGVPGPTACVLEPGFDPDPANPGGPFRPITTDRTQISPATFPAESFYFMASTSGIQGGIDLTLYEAALEAGFVAAVVNNGQAAFTRVRIRANVSLPGTYTVTHPYGVETFVVAAIGPGPEINFTNDIPGLVANQFDAPVDPIAAGFVAPFVGPNFLTNANGTLFTHPVTGNRHIGNNATPVAVRGGLNGVNTLTITGPAGTFISTTFILSSGPLVGIEVTPPVGGNDFGVFKLTIPAPAKTFTVTNFTGLPATIAPLTSSNPAFTFPAAADTCSNTVLDAVAPGNSCTFDVLFTPVAPDGAVTGTITVSTVNAPDATVIVTGTGDGTPPVLTVGQNVFTNTLSATISGTATDNIAVHDIFVLLGAIEQGVSTVTNGNWSFIVSGLTLNAPNVFTVSAVDTALPAPGNTTTLTTTVTHDNILPNIGIISPADGLTNNPGPTLTFNVTETNPAVNIVKVDGTAVTPTPAALGPLPDGTHTVTVEATDSAGNLGTHTNTFTVDATPPAITVTSPKIFNGRLGATSPALTFTVNDANHVPANTVVTLDNVVVAAGTASIGPFTAGSNHTLTIVATDGATNSATTALVFTIVLSDGRIVSLGASEPTINDALMALRAAVQLVTLTPDEFAHADVAPLDANGVPNPNNSVDIADALIILRKIVGLVTTF